VSNVELIDMKPYLFFLLFMIAFANVNAQSLEVSPLLNLSTEQRLEKCSGVGVMYSHRISKNFSLGLSVFYKSLYSNFAEINRPDDPIDPVTFSEINAQSRNVSIRTGAQHHIIDSELIGFSLGPELSYNWFWGADKEFSYNVNKGTSYYSRYKYNSHFVGVGFLIKLELKKILIERLSICVNTRPELALEIPEENNSSPFEYGMGNAEFMIGLKYRLIKN
jgi:hypothetical protein